MDALQTLLEPLSATPRLETTIFVVLLFAAALAADFVTRRVLLRLFVKAVSGSSSAYGGALLDRGVVARLAHVVPAVVIFTGIAYVPGLPDTAVLLVRNLANAYMILTVALSLGKLLNALGDIYERLDPLRARNKPIKGYLQLVKIIGFIFAAVLVIAVLLNRSPLLLLSGLGAMTAVLLLVFKDTIMSFVASVQLSSQDMLRVGDWIEMPALNADGDVIDIALHTVKVQNWDRTITTIPTWRLINESFKNWRGMNDTGGRRIKRALYIDQSSIRFLNEEERDRMKRFALIDAYLERKREELERYNEVLLAQGRDPVNTRRVTNIGTFRAYVAAYLEAHPRIHQGLTKMVRQLQPGPTGLPLEIYCFTATTAWVEYEGIQADIFDHLYAIVPEFGLRVFQEPTGADLGRWLPEVAGNADPG
ncbi:mechanosensitive ion channel family protein [Wenzhouxiangella sp. XN24]|uniref:mechanosensitive ion channel family protein n=1 Tax=Wenzhouxiangella sp. XN24 TaxID=2713569 RepID=UPI0013ED9BB1|nr:mechanosensitive ion channel family protein [Wenzhouxiangella sp. XN24]NGX14988.1 mechanosensitive ion channel family protein [Wenzhouxiangella sp. XN24]